MDKKDALELYKHEDNLNWTKLNHLIISTAAIATGIGLILVEFYEKPYPIYTILIHLLFILGSFVILGFAISLNSGVSNMKYWKDRILNENEESNECKCHINNKGDLENPSTRIVLLTLPWIVLGIWSFAYFSFCCINLLIK